MCCKLRTSVSGVQSSTFSSGKTILMALRKAAPVMTTEPASSPRNEHLPAPGKASLSFFVPYYDPLSYPRTALVSLHSS